MNCANAKTLIHDYIDNELDAEQMAALEAHLSKCFDCATVFNETASTVLLLLEVESVPVPASFDERLHQALLLEKQTQYEKPEKQKRAAGYNKKLKAISGIAAVLVIGIFSFTMFNHMGNQGGGAPNMHGEIMPSMRTMLDYSELEQFINNGDFAHETDEITLRIPHFESDYAWDEEDVVEIAEVAEEAMEEDEALALEPEQVDYDEAPEQAAYDEAPEQAIEQAQHDIAGAAGAAAPEEAYGEMAAADAVDAPIIGVEHYFALIAERYADRSFEILGYSYNEATRIFTIEVYVITVPGLVTETHVFRGLDGNMWQVVRD